MKLISAGDSWTFGSEICCPRIASTYDSSIHSTTYDYLESNDYYRIPRIWSSILAKKFNCENINLSWPADDNTTILQKTIGYITSEFISKGKKLDDIFLIIGWSSPERNVFWYKDEEESYRMRLWPNGKFYDKPQKEQFWQSYVNYFWNPEEYVARFVLNNMTLQNFCESNNIKWLAFNSFYQTPNVHHPTQWEDFDAVKYLKNLPRENFVYFDGEIRQNWQLDYLNVWKTIDSLRFYKKNFSKNSFKNFMEENSINPYVGWHPSEESHNLWAEELHNYITNNNLL